MTLTDVLTIVAILFSPLIAVQVTQWLNQKKEEKSRKVEIFKTLMETRATSLSPKHIEALNRIDVEFHKTNRRVSEAWKIYHDHLHSTTELLEGDELKNWNEKQKELLTDLLYEMADALGYEFNKVVIKRGHYYPRGYGDIETDQYIIRKSLVELLTHRRAFPVITYPPPQPQEPIHDQEISNLLKDIQK